MNISSRAIERKAQRVLARFTEYQNRDTSNGVDVPFRQWVSLALPHYFTAPPSSFHIWLAEHLEQLEGVRGIRENIVAPRGSAKSTWLSMAYPLDRAVKRRERFIILTADTRLQAEKYLDAIKFELAENPYIADHHPDAHGKGQVWRSDAIELRNGVRIEALGTGAKLRGRKYKQYRPSLIIVDDPQGTEHIVSELQRTRSWDWLTQDVMNAGDPQTNIIAAGTALHEEAIVYRLRKTAGWVSNLFRAVVSWPERMDLWREWENVLLDWENSEREQAARSFYDSRPEMNEGAKVLWPDRESLYFLMSHRASIGESAFNYEKQNEPINPSLCEWSPELFEHAGFWFDQWPDGLEVRTLYLDPSKGSRDKDTDFSAYVRYGRTKDRIEYVEADLSNRRDSQQIVYDGVEHVRQFRPDGFGVESNAFQDLLAPLFRQEAVRQDVELPLQLVNNTTEKKVRIRRLTEPLTQRRMRFKRGSKGTALLVHQLQQFPLASHDDGPDALEGARRVAINLLNGRKFR